MVLIAIRYNGLVKETARCIDAIVKRSLYENYELAVWNVSCDTREELEYFGRLKECKKIQVLHDFEDISLKDAKHIVWLDSGVEVANREWIQELLMYSQRDDVGAVGGKILDSRRRVVENGYIVGAGKDGVAMASHEGAGAFSTGYIQRLYFAQNVSALSDKMLMVKAELFQKTGGFDRTLTLHYAAIDLCLKLREQGFVNIVNPYADAYFCRNHQQASEKEMMEDSIVQMKKRWKEAFEKGDPYYNPNLSLDTSWMMKEDGYGTGCCSK